MPNMLSLLSLGLLPSLTSQKLYTAPIHMPYMHILLLLTVSPCSISMVPLFFGAVQIFMAPATKIAESAESHAFGAGAGELELVVCMILECGMYFLAFVTFVQQ